MSEFISIFDFLLSFGAGLQEVSNLSTGWSIVVHCWSLLSQIDFFGVELSSSWDSAAILISSFCFSI